jgi:Delta24-sterol reductase
MEFKSYLQHELDTKEIATQVKKANGQIVLQRESSCCSRSFIYKKGKSLVDISKLTYCLELDIENKFIVIEPLITMEDLANKTLAVSLIPPVITEFKHMTVGGAIQGLGGESSSFRFGFIDDNVIEYEVILGNGEIIYVDRQIHSDLFSALPGSFGSLAIITKIKLRLVHATKYVKVNYIRVNSIEEVHNQFQNSLRENIDTDFIECVALSANDYRIGIANKYDNIRLTDWFLHRQSLKHSFSPWYYYHLVELSSKFKSYEYLQYKDYLFRWDRGAFWFGLFFKHNLFNRIVFGSRLTCKNLYKHMYKLPLKERDHNFMTQDILIPLKEMQVFFQYLNKNIKVFPLWLIPIKASEEIKLFSIENYIDEAYVDFGIWGPIKDPHNFIEINRKLEEFTVQCQGRKWLWGQSFFTFDEFWNIYNKKRYDDLREKYHAENRFVNIYFKVSELYNSLNS